MKTLSSMALKEPFILEAEKIYGKIQHYFEIMETLFAAIDHELGITKEEIKDDLFGIQFRVARTHLVSIAYSRGIPVDAIAYHIRKMPKNVESMLVEHENEMIFFRGQYKKDHEEMLSFLDGKSQGLRRGVPCKIAFSEEDFSIILTEVQIKSVILARLFTLFRQISKTQKGNFEINISHRKLEDLVFFSGIRSKN